MQPTNSRTGTLSPRRRTALIVLTVVVALVAAGALHLVGVLPPG